MRLYEDIESSDYLISLQKSLLKRKSSQRFPVNKEVVAALKERDIYAIQTKNRSYFLERLENHENREPVRIENNPDITIEHIFPQNPDPQWRLKVGNDEFNIIKEKYLNTISNLTLSGNNGKLGNKYFLDKRDMNDDGKEQGYRFSRLWLNKYLASLEKWDVEEIEKRFNIISERFLKVWPSPLASVDEDTPGGEVSIFDAEDPTT